MSLLEEAMQEQRQKDREEENFQEAVNNLYRAFQELCGDKVPHRVEGRELLIGTSRSQVKLTPVPERKSVQYTYKFTSLNDPETVRVNPIFEEKQDGRLFGWIGPGRGAGSDHLEWSCVPCA